MPDKILIAEISGAHGIKGFVRLKCFSESPRSVLDYKPLTDKDGKVWEIIAHQNEKSTNIVVHFNGIDDRNTAEAIRGTELFAPRDSIVESGELLLSELAGFRVINKEKQDVGKVLQVADFGAGDTLEITLPDDKTGLVLMNKDGVLDIDIASKLITINQDFMV